MTWPRSGRSFDLVIFMGVLYHLRHPLLALDLIREHVVGDLMLFQTMQQGSNDVLLVPEDHPFHIPGTTRPPAYFDNPAYPKMHFIERAFANDWTNWWAPNKACSQAMLRAAGFAIEAEPEDEVYLCRVAPVPYAGWGLPNAVYPRKGERRMIEAAMLWNEPNNKSHWDPRSIPTGRSIADTVIRAGSAIREVNPRHDARARRHVADRPALAARMAGMARWTLSMPSRCTASRSTGICGRSRNGRTRSPRSRRCDRQAGLGDRGRRQLVRCGGSPGLRAAAHRRTAHRPGAQYLLVFAVRPADEPGGPRRGIAKPRAQSITGISIWG
jgi:hypothetical protein